MSPVLPALPLVDAFILERAIMLSFAALRYAILIVCSAISLVNAYTANLTFRAKFGASPAPFKIDLEPEFVHQTKLKASLTRYASDLNQPDFVDGPPQHNVSTVRDYWVEKYDWFDVQNQLNAKYVELFQTVG